ncbi:MAG: hypothetical protein ACYC0Q_01330 [Eubacteriales bacterium]
MCHWNEKDSWVAAAAYSGGSGADLCITCEENEKNGYGGERCRTCPEAVRQFPGQPEEHFNWRDCSCQVCQELQQRFFRRKTR